MPVLESEFGDVSPYVCSSYFLVRFGLLKGHLLVNSCPLGWSYVLIVFCLFVIFIYFPFGFKSGLWFLIARVPVHYFSITF